MRTEEFYPLARTLPEGWFSEYDMEAICPALEAIPEKGLYLEIGVHKGLSLAFARTVTKPSVEVYGIDSVDKLDDEWFSNKEPQVSFIHEPAHEAVKNWKKPIDVLFIDGDHTREGCMENWKDFSPFVKPGGMVFFHDTDSTSPGVVEVFSKIKKGWTDKVLYIHKMNGKKTSMASVKKI